jgi:hypothetical protein
LGLPNMPPLRFAPHTSRWSVAIVALTPPAWLKRMPALADACRPPRRSAVDLDALARSLDVQVLHRSLGPRLRGETHDAKVVVLHRKLRGRERRFTLAHELGHILVRRGRAPWLARDDEERFADAFARELLVPSSMLRGCDVSDAVRLAARFSAPLNCVLLQFVAQGLLPPLAVTRDRVVLCIRCGDWPHVKACACRAHRVAGGVGLPVATA